jgi:hypothetical protein
MKKFEDILAESGFSEEGQEMIKEAFESRLQEAREELTAELREEFAQKFEHDKAIMVESMDKFLNDKVAAELAEFADDRKALAEERVKYKARVAEHVKTLERFIVETLAGEVKELRADRDAAKANVHKLEEFVLKQLAEEVKDFHSDKKALAEQRVKIVREGKQELAKTKQNFVKKAASVIEESINKTLRKEINTFRADIKEARENDFGRRIFESFVGEYMTSHLNESGEVRKLQNEMEALNKKLDEALVQKAEQKQLTESVERKLAAAKDRMNRDKKLGELLGPLGKQQKAIMEDLLETVKTEKLEENFKKYLPAVLNENTRNTERQGRSKLNESRKSDVRTAKTGDKRANAAQQQEDDKALAEIQQLKKMAGI